MYLRTSASAYIYTYIRTCTCNHNIVVTARHFVLISSMRHAVLHEHKPYALQRSSLKSVILFFKKVLAIFFKKVLAKSGSCLFCALFCVSAVSCVVFVCFCWTFDACVHMHFEHLSSTLIQMYIYICV